MVNKQQIIPIKIHQNHQKISKNIYTHPQLRENLKYFFLFLHDVCQIIKPELKPKSLFILNFHSLPRSPSIPTSGPFPFFFVRRYNVHHDFLWIILLYSIRYYTYIFKFPVWDLILMFSIFIFHLLFHLFDEYFWEQYCGEGDRKRGQNKLKNEWFDGVKW